MIHIVYSISKYLFKGVLLSAMSIIKHCKEPIHIHVLSNDVSYQNPTYLSMTDEQNEFLTSVLKSVNKESLSSIVDVSKEYDKYFKESKNKNSEYTPYALNRLFLDILDDIPDKVIYLDSDTMACGDISELYNIDVTNYEFGAALDYMGKFWISRTYTNSGVLVMNIKKIRETGMLEKSRYLVQNKWMKMPDQTAMNKSIKAKKIIDGKFNEQRNIKPDTIVKHFCKGIKYWPFFHIYNIKQWDIERVHKKFKIHDFDDIYEIYSKMIKDHPFILG